MSCTVNLYICTHKNSLTAPFRNFHTIMHSIGSYSILFISRLIADIRHLLLILVELLSVPDNVVCMPEIIHPSSIKKFKSVLCKSKTQKVFITLISKKSCFQNNGNNCVYIKYLGTCAIF